MAKRPWVLATVICAVIVTGASLGMLIFWLFEWPYVYSGVRLEGFPVGGYSREHLTKFVTNWADELGKHTIRATYGDVAFALSPALFQYSVNVDHTVNEVWGVGRDGPISQRVGILRNSIRGEHLVTLHTTYDAEKFDRIIAEWAEKLFVPAYNASFSLATGKVIPERPGRRLNVEETRKRVLEALKLKQTNILLVVERVTPKITAEKIKETGTGHMLAVFSTEFNAGDYNRSENIKLASQKINGTILQPGEEFSFNEVVGPRERSLGFREALEIVNGELVPGIGGGVCQVSSTLYNAALRANLTVVERTNHSRPLSYVALGRDATVVYGYLDLKFVNSHKYPVIIISEFDSGEIKIGIFGKAKEEQVEVYTADTRVIEPATVKKEDPDLYAGETVQEKKGALGYEVVTVKVVRQNGREVSREVISVDRYTPEDIVVRVGIRPVPAKLPEPGLVKPPVKPEGGVIGPARNI